MEAEKYRKASAQEVKPIAKYILQNFIQVIYLIIYKSRISGFYLERYTVLFHDPHCLFQSGSVQEINIDSTIHHQALDGLAKNPPIGDCLIHAQEHIFKLMKLSAYPRFINTLPK